MKNGKFRVDLHNHSRHSPDGGATYFQIIDAASMNDVDFLAITDHDFQPSIEDMLEVDKYTKDKRMTVFLGVENSMDQGVHVQSFYPQIVGKESQDDVKQYLLDRKNVLEGIDQAGILMHQNYKRLGYPLELSEIEQLVGRDSFQTLFFFTALGKKFPELYGTTFAENRKGAMNEDNESFDGVNPSTKVYCQTTCDLAKESDEFHEKLRDGYGITIPQGTSKLDPSEVIRFMRDYKGITILAHPGLIKKPLFEKNIRSWINAGLDAISCEGYPYERISGGLNETWQNEGFTVDSFNAQLKERYIKGSNLYTSGGTDSHQSTKDYQSFNGLLAGDNAFEKSTQDFNRTIVTKLIEAKKAFYDRYRR